MSEAAEGQPAEPEKVRRAEPEKGIETLLALSDRAWRDFDGRRSYEWKMSFGVWTALGAFAGLVMERQPQMTPQVAGLLVALTLAVGGVYVLIWIPGMYARQMKDLKTMHWHLNLAEDVFFDPQERGQWSEPRPWHERRSPRYRHEKPAESRREPWKNWSNASQCLITLFFVALAIAAILGSP